MSACAFQHALGNHQGQYHCSNLHYRLAAVDANANAQVVHLRVRTARASGGGANAWLWVMRELREDAGGVGARPSSS